VLVAFLAVLLSLSAASIAAAPSAHGSVYGKVLGLNEPYVQFAFNVQDTGPEPEDDRGTLSGRLFDPETGKLTGVLVSTRVFNVVVNEDGSFYFVATLRLVTGTFPTGQRTFQFYGHDGGAIDQFQIAVFDVEIIRAVIVARTP
jgi:hypothetical protein